MSAQRSWSKQKFAKPQFQVYSFFSGLRVQHAEVELRAGRGQRRCHGCRIENEARGSSADQPAPAVIAECCHQVSRAHTAGSGWFKRRKKSSEPFPGILQWEAAFWPTTWLLNGGNFCRVSPNHRNILDVTKPQTNNDSVWVSLCAGQVLFDTVYLLVERTCASNVRQDRKFQAQRDVQCLWMCKMHQCVELWSIECVRDKVRDTDSDYVRRNSAIAVLARRRSEILDRCGKLFSFH